MSDQDEAGHRPSAGHAGSHRAEDTLRPSSEQPPAGPELGPTGRSDAADAHGEADGGDRESDIDPPSGWSDRPAPGAGLPARGKADPDAGQPHDGNRGGRRDGDGGGFGRGRHITPHFRQPGKLGPSRETLLEPYGWEFHPGAEEVSGDIHKYVGIALKHRWLILSVAAVTTMLGLFYTLLQTPLYRASATIEIKREMANISGVGGFEMAESGRGAEFYQNQYELLKSRSLAQHVVASNGLADNPNFLRGTPSAWTTLHGMILSIGQAVETSDIRGSERRAIGLVVSGLTVEPVRSSSLVRISFDSPDRQVAQSVANAVAESFIRTNLERRFEASGYARTFLQERLEELRRNLEESEMALVAYAQDQGIVTDENAQNLAQSNLVAANQALTAAEQEAFRKEALWRQATAGETLPQSLESGAIASLQSARAQLSAEYHDKLILFKPDYPEMAHLRARINEIDRQIAAEVGRIRESLKLAYEAALAEQQALDRQIVELTTQVMDFRNRNIQYTILRREVDTNRSLYEGLLQRYKEVGVAGGIDQGNMANNVSFVDRAELPGSPYTPRLRYNLALSLMFGLMLGGAAAFGRELLDDTLKGPEDVEELLGLPLLGLIPKGDFENLSKCLDDPDSAIGEAYRSLRTALQFANPAGLPRSLLVTSAEAGEGKSTAALSIARNFAKLGFKVLLIDADLRRPSLHRLLGCDPESGLTNILTDGADPPHVFQFPDVRNLTFLPSGPLPSQPTELLAGANMASLLTVACEQFDLVIVDARPVGGFADAPTLGSIAAATLVIVEAHQTSRKRIMTALKRLHFAHADLIGVVLNKFDADRSGYGYGYGNDGEYSLGLDDLRRLVGPRET